MTARTPSRRPPGSPAYSNTAVSSSQLRTAAELHAVARFKQLTEQVLPALARQHRWPVCLDHCFKRICLDHAFGDVWYRHLARPAERHLTGNALARAVACAEEIAREGLPLLSARNHASLDVRGKLTAHAAR